MKKIYQLTLIFLMLFFASANSFADLSIDSVKVKDISCFGYDDGEITVYISGGTPDYRYALIKGFVDPEIIETSDWIPDLSHTFDDLPPAHNYWVAVEDSDGTEVAKFDIPTVHEPDELIVDITPDPAQACLDMVLQLDGNPEGGTPPYSHLWTGDTGPLSDVNIQDPLFISSTPGDYNLTYTVTDDNLCITSDDITVIVYEDVDGGEIAEDQAICYSDIPLPFTNEVSPSGGFGEWTYQWQYMVDGGSWTDIPGANELEYAVTDPLTETTHYRRLATNECGTAESNVVTVTVYDEMDGGEIAEDQDICYEAIPEPFTNVTSPSGGYGEWTYQWQYMVDGGSWTDIPGANDLEYAVTEPLTETTYYRRLATNECGTVESNVITVTVHGEMDGGEIAESQDICYEAIPEPFTNVTSPSGGYGEWTYQWQYMVDGGSWTDIPGANELEYAVTEPLTETTHYRRLATNECGTVESNVITVTVYDEMDGGEIAESQDICYEAIPEPFTNVVSPSGGYGEWTYQWQYMVDGGSWTDIPGANGLEYAVTEPLTETTHYRRLATNECGTAASNVITVTVHGEMDGGEIAENQTICHGAIPEPFTNVTSPTGGYGEWTYQWQYMVDGGSWTDIPGANELEYAVTEPLTETTHYRRLATNECGTVESNTITVTLYGEMDGGEIAESQDICYEAIPEPFTNVTSPSGGYGEWTYQWQYMVDGGSWTDIPGANELEYAVTEPLTETTHYRRLATNECGTAESNVITVTVYGEMDGGEIAESQTICYNEIPEPFTNVTSPSGGYGDWTYQWQYMVDGDPWTDIPGANELEYAVTEPLTETTHYRRLATNECGTAISNVITVTVLDEITIEIITTPVTCHGGEDGTAHAIVIGGTPPYYYIWEDSDGNIIAEGEGVDFIDGLAAGTYDVTVIDDIGCTATKGFYIYEAAEPLYANAGSDAAICSEMNYGWHELGGDEGWPTGSGGEPFYDPETGEYYYEYHWTAEEHDPSLEGQEHLSNPIVTPMKKTTYTVEVTDSLGCIAYDSAVIDVFPTVVADAGGDEYGNVYLCEGITIKLGGTPLGEGPTGYYLNDPIVPPPDQFTYNWRIIEPVNEFLSSDPHPEVSPVVTSTYRVRVRDIDGPGCYHLDTVTVIVWEAIEVEAYAYPNDSICNPNNAGITEVTLGANIEPPSPPEGEYIYHWTSEPHDPSLEGQEHLLEPTVSPLVTTTYTIQASFPVGIGCDGYDSVVITVHPEIVADAGEDGFLCDPETETYILGGDPTAEYIDGSPGDFTYLWTANPEDPSLEGQEHLANPEVAPEQVTTYYLIVEDEFECMEMDSVTVLVADEILSAYFDPDEVEVDCYGDTYEAEVIVEGGFPPFSYEWDPEPIEQEENTATLIAGEYTVTVIDSLGCETAAYITVTEPDELLISVAATDPSSPTEYDGYIEVEITQETYANYDYYLYIWDDDSWVLIDEELNTVSLGHTFENLGIGEYRVEVIDANGCVVTEYVTLSILSVLIESTDVTCFGYCDGTITIVITGMSITNIEWFKDGEPYDMEEHLDPEEEYHYIELCPGFYEVYIEDDYGNEAYASTTISEPDPIIIDLMSIYYTPIICFGDENGEFSLTADGGTGDLYYTLFRNDELYAGPQINDGSFTGLPAGTYYIEVTDDNDCGPTLSPTITIEELDDTYAGEDVTICFGETVQIGPEDAIDGMEYEWTSDPDDPSISDPYIHNPWVSPEVTTTYTLWEEYPPMGCFNSDDVVVTVVGGHYGEENFEICKNDCIVIGKDSIPEHEYEWFSSNPDEPMDYTTSYIEVCPVITTTYTLHEYIPGTEGVEGDMCHNEYDFIVEVHPLPKAETGPDREMCLGDTIQIGGDYSMPLPANTFWWTSDPEDAYISDPEVANPMVSPTVTTTFTFTETYIETGCVDSNKVIVRVYPDIEATAENHGPYCEGDNIELFSQPDGMMDYSWTGPDGWTSPEQNPVRENATFDMAGIYTVTITGEFGENNLLCSITADTDVDIIESPVPLTADDYLFCTPSDLDEPVPIGGEHIEGYTYYWESEPEDEDLVNDIANPFVKPDTTTVYTLWVTNQWGCTSTDSVKVEISDFLLSVFDDPFLCEDDDHVYLGEHLEVTGGTPPYVYSWMDIEGNVFSDNLNPLVTRPLDPYYIFTAGDQQDCFITKNIFVKDIETPIVELEADPSSIVLPGQTVTFIATPDNYHTYDFYVDDELRQSGPDNVYETYEIENGQEVKVIASYYGCDGISNIIIIYLRKFELPNAFIPDEAAFDLNKRFGNYGIGSYGDIKGEKVILEGIRLHLTVFNRWGQKLYEGYNGWDGTYKGKRVAPGTYYYIATYHSYDKKVEIKGSVTVIIPGQ